MIPKRKNRIKSSFDNSNNLFFDYYIWLDTKEVDFVHLFCFLKNHSQKIKTFWFTINPQKDNIILLSQMQQWIASAIKKSMEGQLIVFRHNPNVF